MANFDVILWDVDGTLLDFAAAEKAAIRACFLEFGLGEVSDEKMHDYEQINQKYWQALERGEITRQQVLVDRFVEFFGKYGHPTNIADAFNERYQEALGDTAIYCANAESLVKKIKALGIPQYAVTNGSQVAQDRKLRNSGLINILDKVFISEAIGVDKPSFAFFEPVKKYISENVKPFEDAKIIIIGDSLTSDMQGGVNIGITTCWYNPSGKVTSSRLPLDYIISDLAELDKILGI